MPTFSIDLTDEQATATVEVVARINANRKDEDEAETRRQAAADAGKPEDERREPVERAPLTVEEYLASVLQGHAGEWVKQQREEIRAALSSAK